eukprot:4302646-Pyramimonas_sp.AAC.1
MLAFPPAPLPDAAKQPKRLRGSLQNGPIGFKSAPRRTNVGFKGAEETSKRRPERAPTAAQDRERGPRTRDLRPRRSPRGFK